MSWLFSQALVAEYSAATSSDGAPSAPLSVMPTPHKFWRNDKTMEPSRLSQFGLTCAVLTADHGEALLMSYLAASHARTSRQPARVPALMESAPACGVRWLELSARYDRDSSTWRTHRCLWDEVLPWSSVTLPRWGMSRDGYLYQHPTLERPISASDSGLWPTPTVHGNHNRPGASKNAGWGLSSAAKLWPTPLASDGRRNGAPGDFARKSPSLGVMVQRWPTPNASDSNKWSNQTLIDRKAKGQQVRLNTAVAPGGWQGWPAEPGMGRVADGVAHRLDRIKALGNGQVPRVAAAAFTLLSAGF